MAKRLHPASLIAGLAVLTALSGCASSFALAPYLDQAPGRPVSDLRYPQLHYQKRIRDDASSAVIEYSIDSLWRCRWRFEVEKESGIVRSWAYPDAEAAKWCRTSPSSRP